jgi:hypothetical protein
MKGDFTRSTFKPEKNFTSVRMQQGRVQLDSDWNEQLDIQTHIERVTERDVIGRCGVPAEGGGFEIGVSAGDLTIAPGRIYVDGILVEFQPRPVPFIVTDPANVLVQVGIWAPDSREFAVGQTVSAFDEQAPGDSLALQITAADPVAKTLNLQSIPAGQANLGATLRAFAMPRLTRNPTYATQPYYTDPSNTPLPDGSYLAYLDVWERLRTFWEEPQTQEVALGGSDTATRSQLVWQVKLWPVPAVLNQGQPGFRPIFGGSGGLRNILSERNVGVFANPTVFAGAGAAAAVARQPVATLSPGGLVVGAGASLGVGGIVGATPSPGIGGGTGAGVAGTTEPPAPPDCLSVLTSSDWQDFIAEPKAWMSARATPQPTSTDPCIVPPQAGYRRLENQLYRVEVHTPGTAGTATFKWSRENGSVVTAWDVAQSTPTELSVKTLGRDSVLGFAAGQWVELLDDNFELQQTPGIMVKLNDARMGAEGPVLVIDPTTASSPIDFNQFTRNPKVRRWDQSDPTQIAATGDIVIREGTWINLEGGVQINFQPNGVYETGDYWVVPARTVTGNVEWPVDDAGTPIPEPPAGVRHHYCHLALLQFSGGGWTILDDCQQSFPPAAALGIHITKTNWSNDDSLPVDVLLKQGLQITLDAPPSAKSVTAATVIVELLRPFTGALGDVGIVLAGNVTVQNNVITWLPTEGSVFSELFANLSQLQVRVTLKGHCVWGRFGGKNYYVDGQAFGISDLRSDGKTPRIAMLFPSGNGETASDFESWFWLVPAPQIKIASLTMNPASVLTKGTSTGTITLAAAPPPGGATVLLASSNNNIASVQPSVVVPAGSTSAPFNVVAGTTAGQATITASLGSSTATATLNVIALKEVAVDPPRIGPGGTVTGTVSLTAALPQGAPRATVALSASPALVQFSPPQAVIAAGSASASFKVHVQGTVSGLELLAVPGRTITISASLAGVTVHTSLSVVVVG